MTDSDQWTITDSYWQWPVKTEPLTGNTPTDERNADVAGQGSASE